MAEVHPRRFGKYVLLKPLARGGMGEIHIAATGERGFQKFCVIKKVIAEKADRGKANRFLDEAKVVLRLSHGNLVPTFDAGEVAGEFYIAMELVEGKDLREIWNQCVRTRTRIPLDVALHVGREVARALSYVHSYGDLKLVHRDVAPPNILLSYFGEVKLTDFGLARSVLKQEHTAPGIVYGRASYLAPEQARGEVADSRSDIYSLGIVLYELLTGSQYLQLGGLDAATAMSVIRHPRPVPPSAKAPWVVPELDAIVLRALAPTREQRYQTAEEMRQALSDVIAKSSPRADAERAAEFLRGLYGDGMRTEREERERILAETADTLPPEGDETTRVWTRPPEAPVAPGAPLTAPATPGDFTGRVVDGRYQILRKVGEGGMGTVYAGEHVGIGKAVAVKILHPAYSRQQDLVERFRREARAASRIGHPNIIDVTDFGATEDGCAYFVMELLDGIDLADVLSHERRLETTRAAEITVQICRALEAAHAAGVIHRDLKPENVFLVGRDGKADFVKVLDFGIARSLGRSSRRLTNPGIAMGTPEYMAPEQASGGAADRRTDIYSVGALLYEMLTGTPPFAGTVDGLARRLTELPPPPHEIRPEVPEELGRVVLRALAPDPERRYQAMREMAYDLTRILRGRPRAVAELLGLSQLEARADENGHGLARDESPPPAPPPAAEARPSRDHMATAGTLGAPLARRAEPTAPTRAGSGLRYGAVLGLALVATAGTIAYRRPEWLLPRRTSLGVASPAAAPAAPAPLDLERERAARAQALSAELEEMLSGPGPVTFAALPGIEDRLARLRRDGATSAADRLATRAAGVLERAAVAELDAGAIDAGISHYKVALAVDPASGGERQLAETLRARGEAALAGNRAPEAVRWAREALSLAEADPDAHALLGAALLRARDFPGAAAEYGKALSSRPEDVGFRRGLARARRGLGLVRPASGLRPAREPAVALPPEQPSDVPAAAPAENDDEKDKEDVERRAPPPDEPAPRAAPAPSAPAAPPASAPGEAAPEQQQ
jgi:serine/threonine protein kinase